MLSNGDQLESRRAGDRCMRHRRQALAAFLLASLAPLAQAQRGPGSSERDGAPPEVPATIAREGERIGEPAQSPPVRASAPEHQRQLAPVAPCFDAVLWRSRLTEPDLDRREAAFVELVAELRRCGQGVRVLESWAASLTEPELSWTARLALREAHRAHPSLVLAIPGATVSDARRSFAIDLSDPARVGMGLRSLEQFAFGLFEGDHGLSLYAPRVVSFQGPPEASARIFSLEVGPERVILRITEGGDRGVWTREHSAASLAALLEENPNLRDEVPGLADMAVRLPLPTEASSSVGFLRWSSGPLRLRLDPHGWRTPQPSISLHGIRLGGSHLPMHVLGVDCQPITPEERDLHALEAGVGLRIVRTIPGTLAHEVELHRGDILVKIDGRPMRECADIVVALAEREAARPLVLGIVDTNGQARTITWRPE